MMTLPEDLSATLYPLAWMLGTWRGWGTAPALGAEGDDRLLALSLDVSADDDTLRHVLRVRWAHSETGIDVLADAHTGLEALEVGEEAWTETGRWTLTRSEPADGPGTETFGEGPLTLTGGRFGGEGVWAARCQGPRIAARLGHGEGLAVDGRRVVDATRMYGLVGGELMWAEEVAPNGADLTPSVTARLARVEA